MGKVLLLLMCFLFGGNYLFSQTTWNGSVSTDWNTAANWSAGVPTSTTNSATIANVSRQPLISVTGAAAKSVTVEIGAGLAIAKAGSLSISGGTSTVGLNNAGSITNNGLININLTAASVFNALVNAGTFTNSVTGQVNIDRSTNRAIDNYGTVFNNAGSMIIGGLASVGVHGLINQTVFNNNTGGMIKIDNVTTNGVYNLGGTFTNSTCASLNIVSNSILNNTGTFNNAGYLIENASGNSSISSNTGTVQNLNGGTFTIGSGNAAITLIGVLFTGCISTNWHSTGNWSTGIAPLSTEVVVIGNTPTQPSINGTGAVAKSVTVSSGAVLTIAAAGGLSINGSTTQGILNNGTVNNNGTLTLGATSSVGSNGI